MTETIEAVTTTTETIYFTYDMVSFRHTAIDSVIDSVISQIQNQKIHAQEIIDSAGK
jgi:hypothetical protein